MSEKKHAGRPKGSVKVKELKMSDMINKNGKTVSLDKNAKNANALAFEKLVNGDDSGTQGNTAKRGMYAGMANPESFIEFYKTTVGKQKKGRPWAYPTALALQTEVTAYFEFCVSRLIAVTVSGLGAWLGVSVTTMRYWKQNKDTMPFYEVIEPAIAFVHSMTEQGAMDGNVPAIAYIFASKNYHGLTDKMDYVVIPHETMTALEQDDIIKQLPDDLKKVKK